MKKFVIITGGSKGIGLALLQAYQKNGYGVISISRTTPKTTKLSLPNHKTPRTHYTCDLSNIISLENTFTEIFSQLNPKEISNLTLFNNAGDLGTINTLENIAPSDISQTLQLNLMAPMVLSGMFVKLSEKWHCKKQIINISSGAAVHPYESWSVYCTSKAGLDMMTKVLAKEQSELKNGVKVTAIYPGVVATNMQTKIRNTPSKNFKDVQRFIDLHETGNLSSPKAVAEKIYQIDALEKLQNGDIIDLRNLD